MALSLYNTLSRSVETFKPLRADVVKVYYCGPTPYNFAHIGNLRNYLNNDLIVRSLRYLGYRVGTVMNITDIDDKTIRDSQRQGKTLKAFTEFYTEEFLRDLERLHIQRADTIEPISRLIPEMGQIISRLIEQGYAYQADDGSIYYRVERFRDYGKFAHLDTKGMISSVRINNDEYEKEQVADFALWKAYDREIDGENKWEIKVPLSSLENDIKGDRMVLGRPGWHIECSACNLKHFGEQIDIHMGGIDLVFPHHQNEIAQTEAFTGKQFSKYWIHGGHLLVDNKKMAKSAGNFYTLQGVLEHYHILFPSRKISDEVIYRAFRLMALQNQYRENFNFTFDRLDSSIRTIEGIDTMMSRLGVYQGVERPTRWAIDRAFRDNLQGFMQDFIACLEDDFAFPQVMAVFFELQKMINTGIDQELFSPQERQALIDLLSSWDAVLGFLDFSLLDRVETPTEILALLEDRQTAKIEKDFVRADAIRDQILALGYRIIDEKSGARVEKVDTEK